jgi:zinc-ribbon domain
MYCPSCGKENPEGRRFCRSCGLSLQAITPALAGESPTTSVEESSVEPSSRLQAAWQNPFIYALLLIVLGVILGAIGERPLRSQTAHDIGTIIALLGVGLLGLKGVMLIVAPPRPALRAKRAMQVEQTSERTLLSAEPPSVTENTTRELDASAESLNERSRDTQPTQ